MSYNIYDTSINSPNLKFSFRIGVWFGRMHLVLNVSVTNKSTWLILKGYQTTGIFEAICCWIGQLANHRYFVVQIHMLQKLNLSLIFKSSIWCKNEDHIVNLITHETQLGKIITGLTFIVKLDWIECEEAAAIILYNDVVFNSHPSNITGGKRRRSSTKWNNIDWIPLNTHEKKDFGCRKVVVNCSSSVVDGWSDVVNAWKSCE